jgi:uncharacterized protein YodC (DUF2158 family)
MIENFNTDKVYFVPGDLVTVKHELPNKPIMWVKSKETKMIKDANAFMGMRCQWFDASNVLHEAIFSTKDLSHINK